MGQVPFFMAVLCAVAGTANSGYAQAGDPRLACADDAAERRMPLNNAMPGVLPFPASGVEARVTFEIEVYSIWSTSGRPSTYCLRWEVENTSAHTGLTQTNTALALNLLIWPDVDYQSDKPLAPGERGFRHDQFPLAVTPIDQPTTITANVHLRFAPQAYLPRHMLAASTGKAGPGLSETEFPLSEKAELGQIVSGFGNGRDGITVTSAASFNGKEVSLDYDVVPDKDSEMKGIRMPFYKLMSSNQLDEKQLRASMEARGNYELMKPRVKPIRRYLPVGLFLDKKIYLVMEPLIIEGKAGRTCALVRTYSPVPNGKRLDSCSPN